MIIARWVVRSYWWFIPLVAFIIGSAWLLRLAWIDYHAPRLLATDPIVYAIQPPDWLFCLIAVPLVVERWWNSPLWLQGPYAMCGLWLFFHLLVYLHAESPETANKLPLTP